MMNRRACFDSRLVVITSLVLCGLCGQVFAQFPAGRRRPMRRPGATGAARNEDTKKDDKDGEKKPALPPIPSDKKLLSLHRQFIADAEKLALDYEQDEDWDRAKSVYQEIVKLAPYHVGAVTRLRLLKARESNAMVERLTVKANQGWQDTRIDVLKGRPVQVRAGGAWTFNLSIRVGPEGIKIPEELKEYNMGCLLGVVKSPGDTKLQPILIGAGKQWMAEKDGRLYLRMYDIAPDDNEGELEVEVRGTYRSMR